MADEPNTPDPALDPANTPDPDPTTDPADPDLGEAGKKAIRSLRAEKAAAEKKVRDLEARFKAIEDAGKTEAQKNADKALEAEARAAKAEQALMRTRIASKHGLDADLADRLNGSTEDELEADAKSLAERFKTAARPRGDVDQGRRGEPAKGTPASDFAAWFAEASK